MLLPQKAISVMNIESYKTNNVADCNIHMGYVDKADRMTNSYSISHRTWKWTKKLFFNLLDMTVSSCSNSVV
jgi:hypothetical protein